MPKLATLRIMQQVIKELKKRDSELEGIVLIRLRKQSRREGWIDIRSNGMKPSRLEGF